ncbi:hypothetical protein [Pseudomonas sp.]|jgi:hypothetical protein|uniref:hypothetical protein n=1 Tax=Pseudomonas sp. TaxID=306 RepID=UPI0026187A3F|nr:hypothetical protein [Pseudomonas sp.]
MAKPNYSFAKRQRDLAKEQKKEEKLQKKTAALTETGAEGETVEGQEPADDAEATPEATPAT